MDCDASVVASEDGATGFGARRIVDADEADKDEVLLHLLTLELLGLLASVLKVWEVRKTENAL
jgi:hypothetical protein